MAGVAPDRVVFLSRPQAAHPQLMYKPQCYAYALFAFLMPDWMRSQACGLSSQLLITRLAPRTSSVMTLTAKSQARFIQPVRTMLF